MGKRLAPHLRALDVREEKLDEMLMRYDEAQETMIHTGVGGDETNVQLMPLCWNMSYRKLEVLLKYMAAVAEGGSADFRSEYCHLREWYWRGEWRRRSIKRKDQVTRKIRVAEAMVFEPGKYADPALVLPALGWLSGHFPGEVYLPQEFLSAAA